MGLKRFRACLSINKEKAYKVPMMTGIYRKMSYAESNILSTRRNEYAHSAVPSSFASDSKSANDKEQQHDRAKDRTSQLLSSSDTDSERTNIVSNEEPTASIKDLNAEKQLPIRGRERKISRISKDQSYVSNTKDRICQETELVI